MLCHIIHDTKCNKMTTYESSSKILSAICWIIREVIFEEFPMGLLLFYDEQLYAQVLSHYISAYL
jgi:hypothetical protein